MCLIINIMYKTRQIPEYFHGLNVISHPYTSKRSSYKRPSFNVFSISFEHFFAIIIVPPLLVCHVTQN